MRFLQKLPGSVRSPSGLEWRLWRKLPWIALIGTALPLLLLGVLHAVAEPLPHGESPRWLGMADILVGAVLVLHWTLLAVVAFGCIVVMIMKGPGYVADGYRVSHADAPRTQPETEAEAATYRSPTPAAPPTPPRRP